MNSSLSGNKNISMVRKAYCAVTKEIAFRPIRIITYSYQSDWVLYMYKKQPWFEHENNNLNDSGSRRWSQITSSCKSFLFGRFEKRMSITINLLGEWRVVLVLEVESLAVKIPASLQIRAVPTVRRWLFYTFIEFLNVQKEVKLRKEILPQKNLRVNVSKNQRK